MGIDSRRLLAATSFKLTFLLAISAIMAISAAPALGQKQLAAHQKNAQPSPVLQKNLSGPDEPPPTAQEIELQKREAARAALIEQMRAQARAEVDAAAKSVRTADPAALAKALRVELAPVSEPSPEVSASSAFRELGDLDGDGHPEAVFRWSRPERSEARTSEEIGTLPGWVLFLFSWDGTRWHVTELMTGDGLCGLDVLPGLWPAPALVAVEGLSNVPYPVIFGLQHHRAFVAWDSRNAASRYQGYARGLVQFEEREDGPPAMIVSGRADPGVIRFSPTGDRGFEAATVYFWEDGAYVPKKTEFAENEDYALYRFLSALHLRDFRSAYTLIDPKLFIKGDEKSLVAFRKSIENDRPEFLGDNIFVAIEASPDQSNKFAFRLERDDIRYLYFPAFSNDGRFLLTGLERRETR